LKSADIDVVKAGFPGQRIDENSGDIASLEPGALYEPAFPLIRWWILAPPEVQALVLRRATFGRKGVRKKGYDEAFPSRQAPAF
jgi:hypothetical protein